MFLGDFHLHSTFSDGQLTIPELVDLFGQRGFGAIAITDHLCENRTLIGKAAEFLNRTLTPANFPFYTEILKSEAERAWKQYKMVVIPGFELTKNSVSNYRSAHMVGLGVSKFISADGDVLDLARAIRAQGALAIAAHPVATRKVEKQTYHIWDRREELANELDAWEVASGPYIFDEVARSNLPKIASSDLHAAWQMTSWKTVFHCERHPEAVLRAIKNQEIEFKFYTEEANHDYRPWDDVLRLGLRPERYDARDLARTP
jgi:predicted metal-dependent phosphoesterase TrpH